MTEPAEPDDDYCGMPSLVGSAIIVAAGLVGLIVVLLVML